jgi:6-phosphofructokinase
MYKTIGIVTGGGDAPGLNAVIRAAVKTAIGEYGMRVIGIEDSFEGLLGKTSARELTPADVRGLLPRGGTILGTRNRGAFVKREENGAHTKPEDSYLEALENLSQLGIEALVVLGGEAHSPSPPSLTGAAFRSSACPKPLTTIWRRQS